jgi:hypothetical protein
MRVALISLVLVVASFGPSVSVAAAANTPLPCTSAPSVTVPPETIRVLRTGSGLVEVVPFKDYVYRTHVAEFWSEYKVAPYSDALLGVGAVAIKQNAWLWTRAARDWWAASSTTSTQRAWVEADYADDRALNGSTGDPSVARLTRAKNHATWALRMRIRYGADRTDNGVGGLVWDATSRTYTAPLAVLDESGAVRPLSADTPRSCFDVTDHPSINQFYRPGGLYEPADPRNDRYNRAVDATWGLTVQRWYEASGDYRLWRPGFYGSLNSTSDCVLPPVPGSTGVVMRHLSQPSHWRGWSFFPMNADSCARSGGLSTEELLRASFYSWDGALVAGAGTSSIADDRYRVDWVRSIRIVSPAADASGDGRGDLVAYNEGGVVRLVSADPRVDAGGRPAGAEVGAIVLTPGELLIERLVGRTSPDGSLAITDLRLDAAGAARLVETPITGGLLGTARTVPIVGVALDPAASLSLAGADTSGDGIEELFLSERLDQSDPVRSRLRLYRIDVDGTATLLLETSVHADPRAIVRDLSGDGLADVVVLSRDQSGTLIGSLALGALSADWSLGALGAPGALLWPLPASYRIAVADALGDGGAELYLSYRDPAGIFRVVRLSLASADPAAPPANPDLVYVAEAEPPLSTRVLAGEARLRYIAKRTGVPLERLVALNAGGYRNETIRPYDTYAKIAKRVGRAEACLRTMNANRVLYRGKTLRVPLDLCVVGATSVLYRGTPIRIRAAETTTLRAGEGTDALIARLATVGVTLDAARLTELNPGLDLATAPAGSELRVRAPWTPVVRTATPPPPVIAGTRTLGWSAPVEVFRGAIAGKTSLSLITREWTGDGVVDLLLVGPTGAGGVTIERLAYRDGRLLALETIARPFVLAGWSLR